MKKKIIAGSIVAVAAFVMVFAASGFATHCDAAGQYDCSGLGGDSDGDGSCNLWETNQFLTDPNDFDSDDGGTCDGDESLLDFTDPLYPIDDIV